MHYGSIYDIEWRYYDLLYGDFHQDIEFYRKIIKGGDVLELMCGTGRISSNISDIASTWCLDIDERMLDIARKKNGMINCIRADARDFHLERKFDYVIIPLNSILLFPSTEKEKMLKNSARHLKDDGKIIVDMISPPDFEESMVYLGDHRTAKDIDIWRFFVPTFSDDMRTLYLTYFYDIFENGEYRRDSAVLTLYLESVNDMKKIIKNSDLQVKDIYGSYGMDRFVPERSEKMIFILAKGADEGRKSS